MERIENKDREHLKLLSIFHYVVGGIVAAFSMLSLLHISIGLSFILSPQKFPTTGDSPPLPDEFGWIFLITGLAFLVIGLTLSICLIASGRFLAKRKRYWFSFIVACFECLFTPFGTVLGVFTVIVLSRDSVKNLYEKNVAPY
jgi:hypothetical protein